MNRICLTRLIRSLICASIVCAALLAGCASEEEQPIEDRLRESLQAALSTFDESSQDSIDSLIAPIDSDSLDSLGISSREIAQMIMDDLVVDVGDVNIDDDVAIAEVYVTCKDIPAVSDAIRDLAKEYSIGSDDADILTSQLAQKAKNLVDQAQSRQFGPIYLEYYRSDNGWVLADESRERLSAVLSEGSTNQDATGNEMANTDTAGRGSDDKETVNQGASNKDATEQGSSKKSTANKDSSKKGASNKK